MDNRQLRISVVAALCAADLLVAPRVAGAAITASDFPTTNGPATLVVLGSNEEDEAGVTIVAFDYIVHSLDGVETSSCIVEDSTSVKCHRYGPRVRIALRDGSDWLKLNRGIGGQADGEDGADTLIGSSGQNTLVGGHGNDELRGRTGDDRLLPQKGADVIQGGPGDDRLNAIDNHRDRTIDCGPGRDVALVDEGIDPPTRRCEQVLPPP
jgi:Ca2+-binding RTX toxin-like protein